MMLAAGAFGSGTCADSAASISCRSHLDWPALGRSRLDLLALGKLGLPRGGALGKLRLPRDGDLAMFRAHRFDRAAVEIAAHGAVGRERVEVLNRARAPLQRVIEGSARDPRELRSRPNQRPTPSARGFASAPNATG